MSIKVHEALKLEYLEEFQCITDNSGLNNIITTVGILDHEQIEHQMHIFEEGEFVLATLSVARNDIALVFESIRNLIKQRVSGLAIKSVYYHTLPQEILEYANINHFPIFIFEPSIFMENIIRTLQSGIKSRGLHDIIETKLETLFSGVVNPYTVEQIALELNTHFKEFHQVIYCTENRFISNENNIKFIEKYMRIQKKDNTHSLLRFRTGILVVLSYDDCPNSIDLDFNYLCTQIGLNLLDYTIGISSLHTSLTQLNQSIKESFYACQAASIEHLPKMNYADLGLYQILIPHLNDSWVVDFSKRLLAPILNYDQRYQTQLYETLRLYFKNGNHTQLTAESLFQHKNTILYRIRKAKELIGLFESDQSFNEQMSVAIKIHESIHHTFT
ncbi:MAG: PucR family transcriptional regulator ligand-binding domain-containing protein [Clostridiales bacterium]|nr:PucR family transcriptional regulator ligand-binding domain-containing protein [Clostridiales bacterium]